MSLQGSNPWPSVQDKCADVAQSADALSSELRDCRFESCRRHRALFEIGGHRWFSRKRERMSPMPGFASLNLTVESCGRGATRQTRSPERAVVGGSSPPVRIRSSRYGAIGRRGSLKNSFLKVRILLPAFAQGLLGYRFRR
jgi:hypothetical protein